MPDLITIPIAGFEPVTVDTSADSDEGQSVINLTTGDDDDTSITLYPAEALHLAEALTHHARKALNKACNQEKT